MGWSSPTSDVKPVSRKNGRRSSTCAPPDRQWIAADDGPILIITGYPPVTRVLTTESSQGAFDPDLARFAITDTNILTPAS